MKRLYSEEELIALIQAEIKKEIDKLPVVPTPKKADSGKVLAVDSDGNYALTSQGE